MSESGATFFNAALSEEVEAVNAIYGTDVVTAKPNPNSTNTLADTIILRLPTQPISFLLSLNNDYPSSSPHIDGTQSAGNLGKGEGHHAVNILQETLRKVWTPGSECLNDLIEEVCPLLQDEPIETDSQAITEKSEAQIPADEVGLTKRETEATSSDRSSSHALPNWTISEPVTEKKSVFIGRCARVADKPEATSFLTDLLSTNKKVAAATHNITAWRIQNARMGVTIQDCDDDGERAAGGRLLHLMQLMDVWNVVVVVTRWYGGVKLGLDRFRLINEAAREALVKGGFVKTEEDKPSKKKGKN
jgi:ubiquitin-protein ligase